MMGFLDRMREARAKANLKKEYYKQLRPSIAQQAREEAAAQIIRERKNTELKRQLSEKKLLERTEARATFGQKLRENIKKRVTQGVQRAQSQAPRSPVGPTTSDRTREIFGGGAGRNVFLEGSGPKNPFYDEPKKEKPEGGKRITITVR